jgi:hypothetical protein
MAFKRNDLPPVLGQELRVRATSAGASAGRRWAVGLAVGRVEGSDEASKELVYEIVGRIFAEFSKRLLVIDCRQLTGLDFNASHVSPDELQKLQRDVCGPLVSFVTLLTIAEL